MGFQFSLTDLKGASKDERRTFFFFFFFFFSRISILSPSGTLWASLRTKKWQPPLSRSSLRDDLYRKRRRRRRKQAQPTPINTLITKTLPAWVSSIWKGPVALPKSNTLYTALTLSRKKCRVVLPPSRWTKEKEIPTPLFQVRSAAQSCEMSSFRHGRQYQ